MKNKLSRFNNRDATAIIIILILWTLICYAVYNFLPAQTVYITAMLSMTVLSSSAVILIRKLGIATLLFTLAGATTMPFNNIGIVGVNKIVLLFIIGLIFDAILFVLKKEKIHAKDIILGATISIALVPLITSLMLTGTVPQAQIIDIVNLTLVSFGIGLGGSSVALLLWHSIRLNKVFLKFEFAD